MKSLTVALGGGGGAGIGHIPVLQGLDDMGVKPAAIVGVSAGALIGAAYAAGLSGDQIHAHVTELAGERGKTLLRAFKPAGMGLDPTGVVEALVPPAVPETFEELVIPFQVGVTDIRARKSLFLSSGNLRSALAASMAIPGLFRTVERDGLQLFDGGVTDNLGLAVLPQADLTLAVDAATEPSHAPFTAQVGAAASIAAMRIMMERMAEENIARHPPDILIRARLKPVKLTEFWRAKSLLEDMADLRDQTRKALAQHL